MRMAARTGNALDPRIGRAVHRCAPLGLFALGALTWSGVTPLIALGAFVPALLVQGGTRRAVGIRALLYYTGSTWPMVPAAAVFFGEGEGALATVALGVGLWLAVSALNASVWMMIAPTTGARRAAAALLGLALTTLPPLGIVGLASPLTAIGWWWPGSGLAGLAVAVAALLGWLAAPTRGLRVGVGGAVLLVAVLLNVRALEPAGADSTAWFGVTTQLGGGEANASDRPHEGRAIETIRRTVATSSASVLVFPEAFLPAWTPAAERFLAPVFADLARQRRIIVLGVMVGADAGRPRGNRVLVRGATHGDQDQHVPVPVSLYRFGAQDSVPLRLTAPWTFDLAGERVGVLVCWEQLLAGPALAIAFEQPDRLIGLANLYFARGTPVAAVQAAALLSWARWLGVPVTRAVNE